MYFDNKQDCHIYSDRIYSEGQLSTLCVKFQDKKSNFQFCRPAICPLHVTVRIGEVYLHLVYFER